MHNQKRTTTIANIPHHKNFIPHGFTLVELLIVIVVIAILAVVSIVAYNGIQQRARNSQQIAAARNYVNLIGLYKEQNGDWPSENGCLGYNNVDTNNDGLLDCNDNGNRTVNPALLTKLATVGSLPDVVTKQTTGVDGIKRGGLRYEYKLLTWFIEGVNNSCGLNNSVRGNSGDAVWCQYSFQ